MHKPLAGKNIAVLVASGFEELQMTEPQKALLALGATMSLSARRAWSMAGMAIRGDITSRSTVNFQPCCRPTMTCCWFPAAHAA